MATNITYRISIWEKSRKVSQLSEKRWNSLSYLFCGLKCGTVHRIVRNRAAEKYIIFGKRAEKSANLVKKSWKSLSYLFYSLKMWNRAQDCAEPSGGEVYNMYLGKEPKSQPTWWKTLRKKFYKLFILWNRAQDCAEPSGGEGQAERLRNAESAAAGPGNGARPPSSLLHQRHPRNPPAGRQCQSSQAEAGRRRWFPKNCLLLAPWGYKVMSSSILADQ